LAASFIFGIAVFARSVVLAVTVAVAFCTGGDPLAWRASRTIWS
jgi:hypothetical protein